MVCNENDNDNVLAAMAFVNIDYSKVRGFSKILDPLLFWGGIGIAFLKLH